MSEEYDARNFVLVPDEARLVIEALDELAEQYGSDPTWSDLKHMTYLATRAKLARLVAFAEAER